ncbi:NF038122 family metalloprotease [Bradyrhizobium sp. GCM10027634]|uniref:NF038122 family metalloprotease n=1 Tax=unclassified Bradyrhizobium TaxID=2631580 RepID=UPI00263AA576|nr:NF038122 family metalloprotease [Bradyrhizobium sp. WYCCWR 12677]MDN5006395.1 NF038122 family metalloprotease [Bradyrhizobium sp. WYCCWR 12677]
MKKGILDQFDSFEFASDVFGAAPLPWFGPWQGTMTHQDQPTAVQVNQGIAPAAGASTVGSATVVTTGGITFDLNFTAAAMAAPASFRAGIVQAATMLANVISDKITVDLKVDYRGTGGGAAAGPDAGLYESYSLIRSDLIKTAAAGDTTFNYLPNTSTIQGSSNVAVWNAELKLFGLMGANDTTTDDGSAVFATDINPSLLVGVALHELTHALGRVPYGSAPDIFDLFRFTSPGVRLFQGGSTAPASYFSLDGGVTKLADFGQQSDPSDFLNSGVQGANDPFNEFYTGSTSQTLSSVDLKLLHALGFHTGSPATPLPDLTVSNLSVIGSTIGFSLNDTGSAAAGTSTSALYLSTHSTVTTSDTLLGTYAGSSLGAGASQSESIAFSLPSNLAAGTYYLGVIADYTSKVAESNETNNTSSSITVSVGNANANTISGSNAIMFGLAGNDTIVSNGGNNVMVGGAGNDSLYGGAGNDQFVFNVTSDGLDQIYNFHAGDRIEFAAAGFGTHLAVSAANTGVLDAAHFVANATGPTTTAQEFWFNTTTHTLYFDANGSAPGGQIAIAHLQNSYVLHNTDIVMV